MQLHLLLLGFVIRIPPSGPRPSILFDLQHGSIALDPSLCWKVSQNRQFIQAFRDSHATEVPQVHLYLADQGNTFFLFKAVCLSNACDQHQDVLLGVLWMRQCPALELITPGNVVRLQQAVAGGWLVMQASTNLAASAVHTTLQGRDVNSAGLHLVYSRLQHKTSQLACIGQACFLSPGLSRCQVPVSSNSPRPMCCAPYLPSRCLMLNCC